MCKKKLEVSPPTHHRRKEQYGGAKEEAVKRLQHLAKENVHPMKLVADQALDISFLKELAQGKW